MHRHSGVFCLGFSSAAIHSNYLSCVPRLCAPDSGVSGRRMSNQDMQISRIRLSDKTSRHCISRNHSLRLCRTFGEVCLSKVSLLFVTKV
jgi:hypothetical protein